MSFEKLLEKSMYVLIAERDHTHKDAVGCRPIVFEQYVDKGSLEAVKARREQLNGCYGETVIAKISLTSH